VWTIQLSMLKPGVEYVLQKGPSRDGPWDDLESVQTPSWALVVIEVPEAEVVWYRLSEG
jgi:hypothetical protein